MLLEIKVWVQMIMASLFGNATPAGGGLQPPGALRATSAAERSAASDGHVRALGDVRDQQLQVIRLAAAHVQREYERLVAETAAAIEQRRRELAAAIVDEWHAGAAPLMAAFIDRRGKPPEPTPEPTDVDDVDARLGRIEAEQSALRQVADGLAAPVALRDLFVRLDARAMEELGAGLRRELIAHAYVDELVRRDPTLRTMIGREDFWSYDGGPSIVAAARFMPRSLESANEFAARLVEMEEGVAAAIRHAGRSAPPAASTIERLAVMRRCATQADRAQHVGDFDQKCRERELAARIEAAAANPRAPVGSQRDRDGQGHPVRLVGGA